LKVNGVKRIGGKHSDLAVAEIYFDTPHYEHGWVPIQSGGFGYSYWSDEYILDVAMRSTFPHGGYHTGGTAIWKESMKSIRGEYGIKNLLKQELKKQGL
jgi:hypothetical protein